MQNPNSNRWTFSLDEVVVEPGHTYMVSVVNLPEPEFGDNRIRKQITVPGCFDRRIQMAQMCLENGSLWDPNMSAAVLADDKSKVSIVVDFETAQYSERYQVSIMNNGVLYSKNVSKENRTSLNVTLEFELWQLPQCETLIMIKPFFIRCKNDCGSVRKRVMYCFNYPRTWVIKVVMGMLAIGGCLVYFMWSTYHKDPLDTSSPAAKEQPEVFQVQERRRVLIIYSLDHPLYKDIVLKLCAFLATKCGTEVVLDLLDSTRLAVLGGIQWLDWHKEQIENSSDKILILCSRGVQAKWRAMCSDRPIFLKEDALSPVGDMLTPSLSLMVPHFIRSASFKKYIVAYFDDVCSEEDIPSPFNITVRYKLMKQFEEVFFRILDTEKQEPGRVKQIEGLLEDKYHQCPSGRALHDAIEAFRDYQLEHPRWFEEELLESSELELEETSDEMYPYPKAITNTITYSGLDSEVVGHVKKQEREVTINKTNLYMAEKLHICSTTVFKPLIERAGLTEYY
ncbi:interleukin-17 receptor A isoform X2 [Mugil cephalus]|nr:interleukin-17 receptor A isoform X2 [Mugil cephalus]